LTCIPRVVIPLAYVLIVVGPVSQSGLESNITGAVVMLLDVDHFRLARPNLAVELTRVADTDVLRGKPLPAGGRNLDLVIGHARPLDEPLADIFISADAAGAMPAAFFIAR
jgi:hypothetical protein